MLHHIRWFELLDTEFEILLSYLDPKLDLDRRFFTTFPFSGRSSTRG